LATLRLRPSFRQIDSAYIKDHKLALSGTITQPGIYEISYHDVASKSRHSAMVYLPADSVQITMLPKADWKRNFYHLFQRLDIGSYLRTNTVFSTSPKQQELNRYYYLNDSLWNKYFVDESLLTAKLVQTYDSGNRALVEQWSDSARQFKTRFPEYMAQSSVLFAKQYPHSDLTAYALLDNAKINQTRTVLRPYYRALPDSLKQSYYGKLLAKEFEEPKQ